MKSSISSNNKKSSTGYDPLKPLVDAYLVVPENDRINENNKQDKSVNIIQGFVDPSTIKSKTEGLPIRSMYDNTGKYFDQYLFNKKFDQYVEEQKKLNLTKERVRLDDLNKAENLKIKPYQLPFDKILINTKNVTFDIFDNLISGDSIKNKLYGDNLFYLGILCLTITLLYTAISFIFD
jgi:hypothetical protein